MKKLMITTFITLFMMINTYATVYYVNDAAAGGGNGLSWGTAFNNLQDALDVATTTGDEIWVTKGIYRPSVDITGNASPSDSRKKTFYVNHNISIHGGFNGTESTLSERILTLIDPTSSTAADATILSGDIDDDEGDINPSGATYASGGGIALGADNSYTVAHIGTGVNIGAVISGCIITAGNATNGTPTTTQDLNGGGVYNEGTNLTLQAVYLAGNAAAVNGAGLYSSGEVTIANSSIFGCNTGGKGGGIFNAGATLTLSSVYFAFAASAGDGGAIYNEGGTGLVQSTMINCAFFNCASTAGNGGVIYNGATNPIVNTLINCTAVKNSAASGTGGVIYSSGGTTTNIYNSIFNENLATSSNLFHSADAALTTTTIEYSLMQGAMGAATETGGSGTFTANDGMIYNENPDLVSTSLGAPDLTLKTESPCINAGNNTILTANSITTDLQSAPRFYCDAVDMGALERSNGKGSIVRDQAIQLNGMNQYVDIGNTINSEFVNKDFTIEAWIKVIAYDASATTETILTNRDGNSGINFCIVGQQDATNQGKLALRIGTSETVFGNSSSTITAGEWTHVAVSFQYNGSNMNDVILYVNGKESANFSLGDDVLTSTANTFIGYESSVGDAINAEIEELRVWSDVRTMEEIQINKRLLLPCGATDVLATYEFNNNADNALELATNGGGDYAGTPVGGPTYVTSMIPLSLGTASRFNITGASSNVLSATDGSSLDVTFGATNNPSGNIVITYLNQNYSGNAPINTTIAGVNGQYVVDNYGLTTTGLDYSITFNVNDAATIDQPVTEYSLEKRGSNDSGDWEVAATEAVTVGNTSGGKFLEFQVTGGSFSQFIPTRGNLLPVELMEFTAILEGNQVNLAWKTASEEQNAGFFVQKSFDGKTWENLDFVEGNGTTYTIQEYELIDENPVKGINYYRLKQVDFDNSFEYSDIRTINFGNIQNEVAIFPNPVDNQLIVTLSNTDTNVLINIFDVTGRKVISDEIERSEERINIDFSQLENGLYILQLNGKDWQRVEKIMVRH